MTEKEDLNEMGRGNRPNYDLSASRVKTHNSCPMKYKLKYEDGRLSTKYQQGYGALGSLVHESIENILTEYPNERHEGVLKQKFKVEYEELKEGEYAEEMATIIDDRQNNTGIECLEVAARFISDQEFSIRENPFGVEAEAVFSVDHHAIEGRTFLGYMDMATDSEIWDWKTGRIRDDTATEEVIQGSVYMGAYHHLYGEMPEKVRFVYLKEEKVRTVEPTQENWQKMIKHTRALLNSQEKDRYPAKPGDQCYFCGYEGWCPSSPTATGQIQEAIEKDPQLWEAI